MHRSSDVPLDIGVVSSKWVNDEGASEAVMEVQWDRPIYRHDTNSSGLKGHTSTEVQSQHISRYPESFLQLYTSPGTLASFHHTEALQPKPWVASQLQKSRHLFVPYIDLLASPKALLATLIQLTSSGIVVIQGVSTTTPSSPEEDWELRKVADTLSHIRETFYGALWDVKSLSKEESKNIAYTDLDLDLHMDLMYLSPPPRYQLLHCLRNRNVTGGESLFVDAFQAARTLFVQDPEAFKVLCETDVAFHYINDGHHLERKHKTIVLAPHGPTLSSDTLPNVTTVNYSPPFQAPLPFETTPPEFYPALQKFASLLRKPEVRYEYLLQEGDLVVFDNRRVLHARKAFTEHWTGKKKPGESNRWLKGCYIQTDPILDKIRTLRTGLGLKGNKH